MQTTLRVSLARPLQSKATKASRLTQPNTPRLVCRSAASSTPSTDASSGVKRATVDSSRTSQQHQSTSTRQNVSASAAATATVPRSAPVEAVDAGVGQGSSGLDFVDLLFLDESKVAQSLAEAVSFQVTCGRPAEALRLMTTAQTAASAGAFNLKKVVQYRDHVTRNLAPTVAQGFANAARAAGHVLAPPAPKAQPKQRVETPASWASSNDMA